MDSFQATIETDYQMLYRNFRIKGVKHVAAAAFNGKSNENRFLCGIPFSHLRSS